MEQVFKRAADGVNLVATDSRIRLIVHLGHCGGDAAATGFLDSLAVNDRDPDPKSAFATKKNQAGTCEVRVSLLRIEYFLERFFGGLNCVVGHVLGRWW